MNTFDETRYAKGYEAAFFMVQRLHPQASSLFILTSTLQVFNLAMQMLKNNASGSEE